jgi:putative endonuclease
LTVGSYVAGVTIETNQFGLTGERVAERWLRGKGWQVLERRYRNGHRDIDLIAERDGLVAFVEVKARSGLVFGDPVAAVNWKKRREMVRSASIWIDRHGREGEQYRFDVIGVLISGERVRIRHIENAFSLTIGA